MASAYDPDVSVSPYFSQIDMKKPFALV
jgi:hypothetical protein